MTHFLLSWVLMAPGLGQESPLAMVLAVTGKVEVQARGVARGLKVMDFLYDRDQLRSAEGEVVVVFLANERRERIKAKQTVTVGKKGCMPEAAVEVLKVADMGNKTVLHGLHSLRAGSRGAISVLRSRTAEAKPAVSPITGARIVSAKPTFSWPKIPRADSYLVELTKNTGVKVWSAETGENRLPYPAKEKALVRGREYTWRVYAVTKDEVKQCGHGGFYVSSAAEAAEIEKLKGLAGSKDLGILVLAAVAYEGKDMYAEALAIYERLCRESPTQPAFHAARASLLDRAGRTADAQQAWSQVEKTGYRTAEK